MSGDRPERRRSAPRLPVRWWSGRRRVRQSDRGRGRGLERGWRRQRQQRDHHHRRRWATSVTRTLGTAAGTQRTLAIVDGLAGSPVTFVHTATAGAASGLTIVSGDDQTGPVSTELPLPLVVQVKRRRRQRRGRGRRLVGHRRGRRERHADAPRRPMPPARPPPPGPWAGARSRQHRQRRGVGYRRGRVQRDGHRRRAGPAVVRTQPSPNAVSGVPLGQQPVIQLLDAGGNEVHPERRRGLRSRSTAAAERSAGPVTRDDGRERTSDVHRPGHYRRAGQPNPQVFGERLRGRHERADHARRGADGHYDHLGLAGPFTDRRRGDRAVHRHVGERHAHGIGAGERMAGTPAPGRCRAGRAAARSSSTPRAIVRSRRPIPAPTGSATATTPSRTRWRHRLRQSCRWRLSRRRRLPVAFRWTPSR